MGTTESTLYEKLSYAVCLTAFVAALAITQANPEILDLAWTTIMLSLTAAGSLAIGGYLFYYRVWDYCNAYLFYSCQGSDVARIASGFLPFLGSAIAVAKSAAKAKEDNQHILNHAVVSACPADMLATVGLFITNGAFLFVSDPEVV